MTCTIIGGHFSYLFEIKGNFEDVAEMVMGWTNYSSYLHSIVNIFAFLLITQIVLQQYLPTVLSKDGQRPLSTLKRPRIPYNVYI